MSAMDAPLVSILIPCYNAERWLAQAIQSALAQSWPRIEIIVVNDGSTDGSLQVARRFERSGVRVVDQSNRGAAAARNAALRNASGDYIEFLDADDLLAADKIDVQVRALAQAAPGTIASASWARFSAHPSEARFVREPAWRDMDGVEFLRLACEGRCMMQPAAWILPRAVVDRIGPWDERLSLNDDGEYFARAVLAASGIVFCEQARVFYRSGVTTSLSARSDRAALESLVLACDLTTRHLLERDDSPQSRAAAAAAWRRAAYEVYPAAPDLSRMAETRARALGRVAWAPPSRRVRLASRAVGWRAAKRLFG